MVNEFRRIMLDGDVKRALGFSVSTDDGTFVKAGLIAMFTIPYDAEITYWSIDSLDKTIGSVKVDVWKKNGSDPVVGDSILTDYLELDGVTTGSSDLSDFSSTTITAGDRIAFYLPFDSSLKKIVVELWVTK